MNKREQKQDYKASQSDASWNSDDATPEVSGQTAIETILRQLKKLEQERFKPPTGTK